MNELQEATLEEAIAFLRGLQDVECTGFVSLQVGHDPTTCPAHDAVASHA